MPASPLALDQNVIAQEADPDLPDRMLIPRAQPLLPSAPRIRHYRGVADLND